MSKRSWAQNSLRCTLLSLIVFPLASICTLVLVHHVIPRGFERNPITIYPPSPLHPRVSMVRCGVRSVLILNIANFRDTCRVTTKNYPKPAGTFFPLGIPKVTRHRIWGFPRCEGVHASNSCFVTLVQVAGWHGICQVAQVEQSNVEIKRCTEPP